MYAVLHYEGAPAAEPTTKAKASAGTLLQESDLRPLDNAPAPGGSGPADRVIDLNFNRGTVGGELEVCPTRSLSHAHF